LRIDGVCRVLLIPCPWCGPRDEPEFSFAGEPVARPTPAASVSDAAWSDYLHFRGNQKGPHREIWCHAAGCGQWFVMVRDTATHEVIATLKPGASV
jgi:heterotetrameric sarcosine oxidase delta subunit